MGTTAAADARTAISVCTAHNMDSIDPLDQNYLNTYMSLVAGTGGVTGGHDASKSKYMELKGTTQIEYWYRRGDATLKGTIDLVNGNTTWETDLKSAKRFNSLAQGLKVSGVATTAADATGATAGFGTLGYNQSLAFPNP